MAHATQVALLVLLLSASQCRAGTFADDITYGDPNGLANTPANIINLFLSPSNNTTFSTSTPPTMQVTGGAVWSYTVSTDGKFAQFLTTSNVGDLTANFDWVQFFDDPASAGGFPGAPYGVDVQQVQYDWATRTIGAGSVTRHLFRFDGTTVYGQSGGTAGFVGPVPEPATFLVLALGGVGLALARRRRAA